MLRAKEPVVADLGLGDLSLSDDALIDAIIEHPVPIERPLVVSPLGVTPCPPADLGLDLLPAA